MRVDVFARITHRDEQNRKCSEWELRMEKQRGINLEEHLFASHLLGVCANMRSSQMLIARAYPTPCSRERVQGKTRTKATTTQKTRNFSHCMLEFVEVLQSFK